MVADGHFGWSIQGGTTTCFWSFEFKGGNATLTFCKSEDGGEFFRRTWTGECQEWSIGGALKNQFWILSILVPAVWIIAVNSSKAFGMLVAIFGLGYAIQREVGKIAGVESVWVVLTDFEEIQIVQADCFTATENVKLHGFINQKGLQLRSGLFELPDVKRGQSFVPKKSDIWHRCDRDAFFKGVRRIR